MNNSRHDMSVASDEAADPISYQPPLGYWLAALLHAALLSFVYGILLPSIAAFTFAVTGLIVGTPAYVLWFSMMVVAYCTSSYLFRYRLVRRVVFDDSAVVFQARHRSARISFDEIELIRIVEDERVRRGYARIIVEGKWGGMRQIVLPESAAEECFQFLLEMSPSAAAIDIDESVVLPADGIDRMAAERRLAGIFARRAWALFAACALGIPTTMFFIYFVVTNRSFTYTNLRAMSLVIGAPVLTIAAGIYGLTSLRKAKRLQARSVGRLDDQESDD